MWLLSTQLSKLQADLAEFDQRYDLPSDESYESFQSRQMGDETDFVALATLV